MAADSRMLSIPHLIVIFVVALVVFGPEKIPELARNLGKIMAEFRRVTGDLRSTFEGHLRDLEREADTRRIAAPAAAPAAAMMPTAAPAAVPGPTRNLRLRRPEPFPRIRRTRQQSRIQTATIPLRLRRMLAPEPARSHARPISDAHGLSQNRFFRRVPVHLSPSTKPNE